MYTIKTIDTEKIKKHGLKKMNECVNAWRQVVFCALISLTETKIKLSLTEIASAGVQTIIVLLAAFPSYHVHHCRRCSAAHRC